MSGFGEKLHTECITADGFAILKSLKGIVRNHEFVLAGGTAVALHLGHRRSADFDFFTEKPFSNEKVFLAVKQLGHTLETLQEEQGTLTLSAAGVKVSFFRIPYPFLEKKDDLSGIPVAGLVDIASMKILAITQRGAKRDFIDLFFILRDVPFAKVAENMIARFGKDRINPVVVGKALVYFSDAETDPEPDFIGKKKDWREIKKYFTDHVQQFVLDIERSKS